MTTARSAGQGLASARSRAAPVGSHLELLDVGPGRAAVDVAESFRDLPGLVLLESLRPGRRSRWSYLAADPLAVVERPTPGPDVFADARRELARMAAGPATGHAESRDGRSSEPGERGSSEHPPFAGGLVGFLGYDVGRWLERLPSIARDDLDLPPLRLALHDWVVAWDRRAGRVWLAGRVVDGDERRLERRLADVRERLRASVAWPSPAGATVSEEPVFASNLGRSAYEAAVEHVRSAIAAGEIYQANLARRLSTPFVADPWPLYRRLRTGDPSLFGAYLDLGSAMLGGASGGGSRADGGTRGVGGPRAILSASPEPFLSLDARGVVETDPIKGTRPLGRTPEETRELARELLGSAKDRAENVMIVDVLRNDLGRVCIPGSVRVPRLCRLERTAAVQHLVSTVVGRLAPGRDAFDLLAASFPGGSITGAPKIRAMEIVEGLEPVRRGPYTGALCWIGADGAMGSSILIRTFVADGRRLTLGVGGGITHRSDPAGEWEETVAKAAGPLGAIGGREAAAIEGREATAGGGRDATAGGGRDAAARASR